MQREVLVISSLERLLRAARARDREASLVSSGTSDSPMAERRLRRSRCAARVGRGHQRCAPLPPAPVGSRAWSGSRSRPARARVRRPRRADTKCTGMRAVADRAQRLHHGPAVDVRQLDVQHDARGMCCLRQRKPVLTVAGDQHSSPQACTISTQLLGQHGVVFDDQQLGRLAELAGLADRPLAAGHAWRGARARPAALRADPRQIAGEACCPAPPLSQLQLAAQQRRPARARWPDRARCRRSGDRSSPRPARRARRRAPVRARDADAGVGHRQRQRGLSARLGPRDRASRSGGRSVHASPARAP